MHDRASQPYRRIGSARSRSHRDAGDLRQACSTRRAFSRRRTRRSDICRLITCGLLLRGRTLMRKLNRDQIAARVARDIPDGAYVNLGIGLPTLVANHIPKDREIVLHSENGILGLGPKPAPGAEDEDLIDAGKAPATALPGASYFHHADSFSMIRGGHIDICVLGAFQVAANGDIANWHTGEADAIPAVGGAMDLAAGAKQVFVTMEHLTKKGE